MTLFGAVELAADEDARPGFRLDRLEVLNWGTFDRHVWAFDVGGDTALLTGDIGSGKSTLVDAVTTLLVPAHRVAYNKAAGAATRERDLRSYVLGHYKSERNETTGTSRPVGLRTDRSTYSVLLARFTNAELDQSVTLAQVFWLREGHPGQPDRFYVVAEQALTIAADFADFGSDMSALRKRLRAAGARVHDTFPDYGRDMRRRLGIPSEQALELLHQTVSMKSVTDLNDFVRSHMLEPFDGASWIDRLLLHFDDLTRAHAAVVRARSQLERLAPLLVDCDTYDRLTARMVDLAADRDALPFFVADRAADLLSARELGLNADIEAALDGLRQVEGRLEELRQRQQELVVERAGHGGDRLAELEQLIRTDTSERERRQQRHHRFTRLLAEAGLPEPVDLANFTAVRAEVARLVQAVDLEQSEVQNELVDAEIAQRALQVEAGEVNAELLSLRERSSNLPRRYLDLRERLAVELGVDTTDVPFAGELLQVRPEAAEWEGAAERLLHGFGLSLLVPTELYTAVSDWIDSHYLGLRLVYYRVPAAVVPSPPPTPAGPGGGVDPDPLYLKVQIAAASPFYGWLERELWRRADHHCARSMDEFRRAGRAVTRAGQIRSDQRHEKNDERPVGDRRTYVLGWSNQQKIDALLEQALSLQRRLEAAAGERSALKVRLGEVGRRRDGLLRLAETDRFEDVDWRSVASRITRLEQEKRDLEGSSRDLARITAELASVAEQIDAAEGRRADANNRLGGLGRDLETCQARLAIARTRLDDPAAATARARFDALATRAAGNGISAAAGTDAGAPATLEAYDAWSDSAAREITAEHDRVVDRARTLSNKIALSMRDFRSDYPPETSEMDADVAAAREYRRLHARLQQDDLPRFEAEFKLYLNTNTIRDVAGFQSALRAELELISERIEVINESLRVIDYNPGRYIRLEAQQTPSVEIRDFRAELRACTDNSLSGGDADQYSEQKFLQVQRIVERFRGRPGQVDADRAWTRRVTDVRNWFVFVASERRHEDDGEHETYSDSGGKSGGQKEKLAYTILAASLAYQYKLDYGARVSRAFRFVVIDEAFGRGSDESTRYALRLFRTLGLQLLVVTPLQKIHVIEPFVATVGFVDNRTGSASRLQTLTIEEFRAQQARHALATAGIAVGDVEGG